MLKLKDEVTPSVCTATSLLNPLQVPIDPVCTPLVKCESEKTADGSGQVSENKIHPLVCRHFFPHLKGCALIVLTDACFTAVIRSRTHLLGTERLAVRGRGAANLHPGGSCGEAA